MEFFNISRCARATFSVLAVCVAAISTSCVSTDSDSSAPLSAGFQNLLQSVVKIDVWTKSQNNGGSHTTRAVGSGVIIGADGTVLTNAHVVNSYAEKIIVTLSNLERVRADFVGWDHWTDLAVIRLDTEDLKRRKIPFNAAKFGDSDTLDVGEVVYAVGTPHGFARTLTRGIVSNNDRFFEGTILNSGYETGSFNTWIQTDAAINPGNSGGPLVLSNGEVVGINTRAVTNSNNLGFAVPINVAKRVAAELVKNGEVKRGYVGIAPAPLQDMEAFFDLDINCGMLVQNVDTLSPSAIAGILPGDIILKIDGRDVDGRFPEQLPAIMRKISETPVGSEITFEILRAGKKMSKTLKSEPLESRVGTEYTLEKWGAGMRDITKAFARESKLPTDSKLMVIGLRNGYPFDDADIKTGDIVVSINRKKVSNRKELEVAYQHYCKNPEKILVEILRDRTISFHIVSPSDK